MRFTEEKELSKRPSKRVNGRGRAKLRAGHFSPLRLDFRAETLNMTCPLGAGRWKGREKCSLFFGIPTAQQPETSRNKAEGDRQRGFYVISYIALLHWWNALMKGISRGKTCHCGWSWKHFHISIQNDTPVSIWDDSHTNCRSSLILSYLLLDKDMIKIKSSGRCSTIVHQNHHHLRISMLMTARIETHPQLTGIIFESFKHIQWRSM